MTKEEHALLLVIAKGVELLLERVASSIPAPNDYGKVQDALCHAIWDLKDADKATHHEE